MMYKVKGKLVIEYNGVIDATNATEAEERVTAVYRRLLENSVDVKGRPYDVVVKPVN